jgi:plasmid stabilization system protein ParE
MPRGAKSKYTDKQERKADHIAEGYEKRGVGKKEAERRAWATVNKDDGGGRTPGGSGRGKLSPKGGRNTQGARPLSWEVKRPEPPYRCKNSPCPGLTAKMKPVPDHALQMLRRVRMAEG